MKHIAWAICLATLSTTAAELKLSENIDVVSINGQSVPHDQRHFQLNEGTQTLAINYAELFPISREQQDLVRSTIRIVRFEAQVGNRYLISAPQMMDLDVAYQYAQDPQFSIQQNSFQPKNIPSWTSSEFITGPMARP